MKILNRAAAIASTGLLTLISMNAGTAGAELATSPPAGAQLPQTLPAQRAAVWLAGQFNSQGFIPITPGSSTADLSSTVQSVLALSAANVDLSVARKGLSYLESHVDAYVTVAGADGPGKLALLILGANAMGVSPRSFGGTDLVARLLATEQTSGPDKGLFGTETQVDDYYAGGYEQGLALAALAAAGIHGTDQTDAAIKWLVSEQCADGGWTTPDNALNSCGGLPASFAGPDTNTTSLALQGLAAQDALTSAASSRAFAFLSKGQDADAGWSYFPNTTATPGSTDPDSTALVIQGLLALGVSPTATSFAKGPATPVSALLFFQLSLGTGAGAFYFPPAPSPANILATYQAVPALEALSFPWGPSGGGYLEVASDGGVFSFGDASYRGSMGGRTLNEPWSGSLRHQTARATGRSPSDGGVFSFGDAAYRGSMGGRTLNAPWSGSHRLQTARATGRSRQTAGSSASATPRTGVPWADAPLTSRGRDRSDTRRQGLLGGRLRRRGLQLRRRRVLRDPWVDAGLTSRRRDRSDTRRQGLLGGRVGRRGLQLRRRRVCGIHGWTQAQRADRRDRSDTRRQGLLGGRVGRRGLQLRRRRVCGIHGWTQAQRADRRDRGGPRATQPIERLRYELSHASNSSTHESSGDCHIDRLFLGRRRRVAHRYCRSGPREQLQHYHRRNRGRRLSLRGEATSSEGARHFVNRIQRHDLGWLYAGRRRGRRPCVHLQDRRRASPQPGALRRHSAGLGLLVLLARGCRTERVDVQLRREQRVTNRRPEASTRGRSERVIRTCNHRSRPIPFGRTTLDPRSRRRRRQEGHHYRSSTSTKSTTGTSPRTTSPATLRPDTSITHLGGQSPTSTAATTSTSEATRCRSYETLLHQCSSLLRVRRRSGDSTLRRPTRAQNRQCLGVAGHF